MMGNIMGGQQISVEAVASYNNFLRTYCELHSEMLPSDAIENATRMWYFYTPEQQMQFGQMAPSKPEVSETPNECSEKVDLLLPGKKKVGKKSAKPRPKVKAAANKRKFVIRATLAKPKRVKKSLARKAKSGNRLVKVTPSVSQEPAQKAFRKFLEELRAGNSEISERDILKKAAQAWCNMGERQRKKFFK